MLRSLSRQSSRTTGRKYKIHQSKTLHTVCKRTNDCHTFVGPQAQLQSRLSGHVTARRVARRLSQPKSTTNAIFA